MTCYTLTQGGERKIDPKYSNYPTFRVQTEIRTKETKNIIMRLTARLLHLLSCLTFEPNVDVIMVQRVCPLKCTQNNQKVITTHVLMHLNPLIIIL